MAHSAPYAAIDAYIEGQMRRLSLSALLRPDPLSAPLYARPGLDCPDQRRLRGNLGHLAHRADPAALADLQGQPSDPMRRPTCEQPNRPLSHP